MTSGLSVNRLECRFGQCRGLGVPSYGIAVYIYYRDHNPPHFHAIYGESEAIIEISTGGILEGRLPRRAAKLVAEWCEIQRDALLADWALAQAQQPLLPIEPLD
ncbi:MAG: DUF4160 domain-containing protein [Pirellulaceae bacterium]|nr:DUF4160 domain-containing protein [Pirellulaceae bacterium]